MVGTVSNQSLLYYRGADATHPNNIMYILGQRGRVYEILLLPVQRHLRISNRPLVQHALFGASVEDYNCESADYDNEVAPKAPVLDIEYI